MSEAVKKTKKNDEKLTKHDESLNSSLMGCSSFHCTETKGGDEARQLQCCACQRLVHYKCSKLPAYMIQAFVEKRIKKYYYCERCITVPVELTHELSPQSNEQQEILRLRREVRRCENLIKVAEENSRMANKLLSEKISEKNNINIDASTENIFVKRLEKIEAMIINQQQQFQTSQKKTYATATSTQANDFKQIIKLAKVEEISEERDRKSRACNIILHGINETNCDTEAQTTADKATVENFLKAIEEKERSTLFVGRIGRMYQGKNRPLKIVLKNENEKKIVFKKLSLLKGNESFKGVSVTEDYTEAERNILKMWSIRASERNNKETEDVIWRVRGSPKTGTLHLKKFSKQPHSNK